MCAAVLAAQSANSHSIQTRQSELYTKVNRDSEYGAPSAPSYSAPAPSYSVPAPSYSAPEASYGAPSTGYGAPSYEEEAGLDLTSIIIPLLALVGLSLLFPTYVSLTTVRKKRDLDGSEGKIFKKFKFLHLKFAALHTFTPTAHLHYTLLCTANLFVPLC